VSPFDGVPRDWRRGAAFRSFVIAALLGIYAWVAGQPRESFAKLLLVAVALQVGVLVLQKFVPPSQLPKALYVYELLIDGATVLLFALAVFGGIASMAAVS
jgi:hypothetical protein